MKKLLLAFLLPVTFHAAAHDHIDIGVDPDDENRLGLYGPVIQYALLVPVGEPFSGYAPNFPGGYYANELTFVTETYVLEPAPGADPRIEFLSVTGPEGSVLAFWEAGANSPTLSMPTGWSAPPDTPLSFPVELGGDGHLHGRIFTATHAGTYQLTFRAIATAGSWTPSLPKTITFHVLPTPPLSIAVSDGNIELQFKSRTNLNYDIQVSTSLTSNDWTIADTLLGTGGTLVWSDPLNNRPRIFYRLVEYQ